MLRPAQRDRTRRAAVQTAAPAAAPSVVLFRPGGAQPQPAPDAAPARALAVDALRGLGILGMVLGQTKPYGVLPPWMYHAQEPPPTHAPNFDLPGLTFPDLVFPIFLFTLGVAIPLSLTGRLERGAGTVAVVRGALWRGVLLVALAVLRLHFASVPPVHEPERAAWTIGLIAFGVFFLLFTRFPAGWSRSLRVALRLAGWSAVALMFATISFPDGSHFKSERIDVILLIGAVCVVFGTAIWLATRGHAWIRVVAAALAAWLQPPYLGALCTTLIGTIVGDMLLAWLRGEARESRGVIVWRRAMSGGTSAVLAAALALVVPVLLVGIQSRQVIATAAVVSLLCAALLYAVRSPATPTEALLKRLVWWGACLLILGVLLDPVVGGTRKEPPTAAWMFQTTGVAIFVLASLILVMNVLEKPRWMRLLVDSGQNPMIAYIGYGTLILPVIGLTGVKHAIESREPAPWVAFGWSVVLTLLVAYVTAFFTRRRVFWRT